MTLTEFLTADYAWAGWTLITTLTSAWAYGIWDAHRKLRR